MVNFPTGKIPNDLDYFRIDCDEGRKKRKCVANEKWKKLEVPTRGKRKQKHRSIQLSGIDVGRFLFHDRQSNVHVRQQECTRSRLSVDGAFDTRQAYDKIELINDVTV